MRFSEHIAVSQKRDIVFRNLPLCESAVALNNGAPRIATGPSIASRLAASAINKRALAIDFEQDALLCRSGWLSPKALCKLAIFSRPREHGAQCALL
jgi:hypothetical protein